MQLSDDSTGQQGGVGEAGDPPGLPGGGGHEAQAGPNQAPGSAHGTPSRASAARKLFYLGMTLAPAAAWWIGFPAALALVMIELVGSMLMEVARRRWGWVNRLLWKLLPTTFRSWEARRVLGSTWFGLGAMVTLLLFGRDVGSTALLYLVWGDPAAEVVGRRWGSPGRKKTLVGSLGCLAACLLAGLVGVTWGGLEPWVALAGALVATATERWSPPPDDNLWMPLAAAVAMAVVGCLVG